MEITVKKPKGKTAKKNKIIKLKVHSDERNEIQKRSDDLHSEFLELDAFTNNKYLESVSAFAMKLVYEHSLGRYDEDFENGWLEQQLPKYIHDIACFPERNCNKLRLKSPLLLLHIVFSIVVNGRHSQRNSVDLIQRIQNITSQEIPEMDL